MKKLTTVIAAASLSVLALASCGTGTINAATPGKAPAAASSSTTSDPGNFPTPDTDTTAEDAATTPDEPEAPSEIRFGQTWTWEDGTSVTVSTPKKFTPSTYAAGTDGFKKFVMFTVTIKNGSKKKLDLFATPNLMSGETEASAVFDTDKGLEGTPNSSIRPGRTAKFKVGYGVTTTTDLVMEYSPTLEHEDAVFTTK
jgi:hypothetical protein